MKLLHAICATLIAVTAVAQSVPESLKTFAEGDLVFVAPATENAITTVTRGSDSIAVDHVGILHRIGGKEGLPYVIEAISRGVCLTPLDSFLVHNEECRLIIARATGLNIEQSISNALHYVGKPYDFIYETTDSAIYCSELVQFSFVGTDGKAIFHQTAMSFHDNSGKILPYWIEHYAQRGLTVPDGEPGTNPTQLLRSPSVKVTGSFNLARQRW